MSRLAVVENGDTMYMRLTWGKIRAGTWRDYEDAYRRVATPDVPGLRARWLVQDTNDPDAGYAVSIWESAEAIAAWESTDAYKTVFLPAMQPFFTNTYTQTVCEVKYHHGVDAAMGLDVP